MSLEKMTLWLRVDAVVSWLVALPGLVDPDGVATLFGAEEASYGFLVRLWSGLLFMFGALAWEASGAPVAKRALLRYLWIEKAIVSAVVLVGHLGGEAPPSLMALVMATNVPWIPLLHSADRALRARAAVS